MENTSSLLFDSTQSKYYVVLNGEAIGPLTSEEIFKKLENHELSLVDYVWMKGQPDWKRIFELKEFAVLVKEKPAASVIKKIEEKLLLEQEKKAKKAAPPKTAAPPPFEEISYYLYFNKTQYGPFRKAELVKIFDSKKADSSAYIWIPGWPTWKPVHEVEDLKDVVSAAKPADEKPKKEASKQITLKKTATDERKEKRSAPRKPLVARLFVAHEEDVVIAVCRDISIGGMQVLTDRIPGAVNSVVKLNVSPADAKNVQGFVAEGEIVRILEDGRGFSFRFLKLSSDAKKAIEKYIEST